jgi:hypothetical protein
MASLALAFDPVAMVGDNLVAEHFAMLTVSRNLSHHFRYFANKVIICTFLLAKSVASPHNWREGTTPPGATDSQPICEP